jgi:TolB-like protein/Tfp pilus assembly protein PilF
LPGPDIFISYNREDVATAQAYRDALAREGYDVWWDATLRSGETYDEVTEAALRAAKAVVVLWSPRSVASRWVRAEATIADRNRTLLPVTIEPCDRPVMFELTQTADLSHWRGETGDPAWQAFLGDVRRMTGTEASALSAPVAGAQAASGGVPFVAVLPIVHRGGESELDFLADDLTEDVTRELAQNSFFKVITAGRLASWRGKSIDYEALGRQFDARYLVEGKLQRAGEEARLTLQIVEAATGSMLRSARLVRKLSDLSSAPEEFAIAVACELGEQILQIETQRALAKQGVLSGWEHVLRAMALVARIGLESERRALQEARKAVAAAPDLGLAHAILAQMYGPLAAMEARELDEAERREIHEHIKRGMELDGDNAAILVFMGIAYMGLGDTESYFRLAQRAVELAPNSPLTHYALGGAHFARGDTIKAISAHERQIQFASHDFYRSIGLVMLGISLCIESRPAEAEDALDRSLALNPDYCVPLMWKALAAAQQGKEQVARDAVNHMREAEPAMTLDQHLRLLVFYPTYAQRLTGVVTTFRRLWAETGDGG